MAFGGAALWGLSGTVAQVLFKDAGISPAWLVTLRLLLAGALLVGLTVLKIGVRSTLSIWKGAPDRIQLIIFGLLGMLGVQYTYFAAIHAGNAATATLLQFLGPVFIILYVALRFLRLPNKLECAALALALLGTYLLVTHGSGRGISVTPMAIGWGLGAAGTAAFYTLYPVPLLKKWGSMSVVGWGMIIGGIGMCFISRPWEVHVQHLSGQYLLGIGFVVLFGTLLPFYLVLESLRFISPSEVGMLNSAEPLAAVIVSVVWLRLSIGWMEALGGACIIATVLLLAVNQKPKKSVQKGTSPV